ncbi:MAG: 1-acyl-sn-glycerol-3-phosphate acyltransferase [Patescibacteria group bacterium]|nr:1-acyl-sn-glycerol-3-phosphate acyltransferase [Patescibacteria group bacterium]
MNPIEYLTWNLPKDSLVEWMPFLRLLKCLTVKRNGSNRKVLERSIQLLKQNEWLCFAVEGGSTWKGELYKEKAGVRIRKPTVFGIGIMVGRTKTKVVPVCVKGPTSPKDWLLKKEKPTKAVT